MALVLLHITGFELGNEQNISINKKLDYSNGHEYDTRLDDKAEYIVYVCFMTLHHHDIVLLRVM